MNPILSFFGLHTPPFALTPNTALYFPCAQAESILQGIDFALKRGEGLIKITGAVGSGKTLLCRMILERLHAQDIHTAYLCAPLVQAENLPYIIAREFGITPQNANDPFMELREHLLAAHAQGIPCVLLIDEAQALREDGLETVRLLLNLETQSAKLLHIVLFAQDELNNLLSKQNMRQLAQRISFGLNTSPLPKNQVAPYLRFRLHHCAMKEAALDIFSKQAIAKIAEASGGIPRLIHILADKSMLAAYASNAALIQEKHVKAAIKDSPHLGLHQKFLFWNKAA